MNSSFRGLGFGLVSAVVLVYLLMVVNFQAWIDPLIILMALPGALSGIAGNTNASVAFAQAIEKHTVPESETAPLLDAVACAAPAPTLSGALIRSMIGVAMAVLAVALIVGIRPRVGRAATLGAEASQV